MARAENTEVIDKFEQFYRDYYRNEIGELAQKYPNEKRSLYIDWDDLYRFDPDLADDFIAQPGQMRDYAEEALRLYDLPVDVKLGQAHVRVQNLQESTPIRDIRARHRGQLISVSGIVRKATDVRPKITEAAFECQRCGTLTRIPQTSGEFHEPHECQGCERQGPFNINFDQSEFVDAQKLRVQESPEGLRGGETPQSIDVHIEDDITGHVTAGDHVRVTGILHLDQQESNQEKSPIFDVYMDGLSVEIEDEQFEDMDITDEDKKEIIELSNDDDIYEKMVESMAPSIYGYEQQKLAIIMQLFSGVTKHLPDGSRIRGDLHMLLIGDPGTGKCQKFNTKVALADGREKEIGKVVEESLEEPVPVDDGVYQETSIPVLTTDGREIKSGTATKVWKREAPERMYRIRTSSGRTLEVTPTHPLFKQNRGSLEAFVAADLSEGDMLAAPRVLPSAADDSINVEYEKGNAANANRLEEPDDLTDDLARLLGYVIGEGHISGDRNSRTLTITNADNEIVEDVSGILENLGLRYQRKTHHTRENVQIVLCSSVELVRYLEAIEPNVLEGSAEQRVPEVLFKASDRRKSEFLRAYVDGEGTISRKERELVVASMSQELLENVQTLLLSFGIWSQIQSRENGSYRLRVSGKDFERYVTQIGFVTARKSSSARAIVDTSSNTNTDTIPNVGEELQRIRETLKLSQFDCGIPRTTYQHYERGDRNPSRSSLKTVLDTFEDRIDQLERLRDRILGGSWDAVSEARKELNISQATLAAGMDVTQTAISYYERNDVVPDGGRVADAEGIVLEKIDDALSVADDIQRLRALTDGDIGWDRIESIETVTPDYDWVYDLEVEGTHSYVSNNVISHNSQLLQYVRNLAPRSVYTSGKGSSSAGLCVTGDTVIHTRDGFRPIREIVAEELSDPVDVETTAERAVGVQTFDREKGEMIAVDSSQVWRMPEKPCCRIETNCGKELEASVNTPILTCGEDGIEWRKISELESGDYVAVPRYDDIDRSEVPVRRYLELSTEKVQLSEASVSFLRQSLQEEFGTLRDAAAALNLSEDFIYLHLKNRHVPLEKLDRMLNAIGATREDVEFDRLMIRHGDSITVPGVFDADLMYLLGLVFGDGDISLARRGGNRGLVRISNSNEELLERAIDIFDEKFDKRPDIEYQDDRVPCIRINSATIARLFSNAGMQTPKEELALAPELTVAEHADSFLRGLMDADGSVSVRDTGGSSVLISTISEELARQVQLMLETYGVRARTRERDRRGTYELDGGHTIESKHVQYFVEIYGADVDRYAEAIGFESVEKQRALARVATGDRRRRETLPIGAALAGVEGAAGEYYQNIHRGDNPGRARARTMLDDIDLGPVEPDVRETVETDLRWAEVVATVDTGHKEVFDLTVPETHNFVGNGIITHNTAAAVRDDFGDGQQWTLEAGALVLADQGIAAVDELDKMRCVTGDTLVHLADGRIMRIGDLAREAEAGGTIEELPNGRTVRDVDFTVWTMTDDGRLIARPVTAVHEYDAPAELTEVTLESGESLTATEDHPFFVFEDGERIERSAADLELGDEVYVPKQGRPAATDGGTVARTEACNEWNVDLRSVERVETVPRSDDDERVYDLTVEGTHNFVANGMVVHNSEDRSAMHEALEQQSYHPDTEILLSDGRRIDIGEFVDERIEANADEVVDGIDCEILPVDDIGVHSTDFETNETTKLPVDRVSRHEAPEEFVRVTFSNGREVTVTPEHPMFVDDDGEIGTVEARDIEEGAFVPAPRKLPNSSAAVELDEEAHVGKEKDVDLPEELSGDLAEVLGFLIAEGHSYAGSAHEIGFSNQDERLLKRMDRLMASVFGVESTDTTNEAGTVTKRWVSTKLYRWFERNFPEFMHTARDKRIPSRVLGGSEEEIRRFLVGAFAGDGGVESEAMSFSTASEGLVRDYADALSKIGVASRIHHDGTEDSWKVYVMGDSTERFVDRVVEPADERHDDAMAFVERSNETKRHHDVLPTSAAREIRNLKRLLGVRLTGRFRTHLDEEYGVQVETVEREMADLRERASEVEAALRKAADLGEIRDAIGWSCRQLAERLSGETTSSISYAENGGYDVSRRATLAERARETVLDALDEFDGRADALEERCDLRYYRVRDVETVPNEGKHACEWVYDVTVEPTNTFVSQGVVLHNSISVSKAGINATLKSRCSLLGAANPKYGRFDQYEPIGEQIDLEPALVSRFDLIFTVTDQPDEEEDANLAEHIINTNYAGELHTHRENTATSNVTEEEVANVTEEVEPTIDAELLRKYIAYAKRNCYPTMTEEAKKEIRDFYVDLRARGQDDDSPVPVTARKLEALVRLAEASARMRLADSVEQEDAERVIEIVRSCLQDIGVDPETGEFDADVVETGQSKSQRDRIKDIKSLISEIEEEYDEGAPIEEVLDRAEEMGTERSKAEHEIEKLRQKGDVYEPKTDHLRTV
jgi:replicative DNA helicase Mcm